MRRVVMLVVFIVGMLLAALTATPASAECWNNPSNPPDVSSILSGEMEPAVCDPAPF